MSRPEHIAPPELYYGDDEARKYSSKCVLQDWEIGKSTLLKGLNALLC